MHGLEIQDNIAVIFKTEKGILGSMNIGWRIATVYDSIHVHGTGGSLFASSQDFEVRYGSYGSLDRIAYHLNSAKEIFRKQISRIGSEVLPDETYLKEDRGFVDAVKQGKKPCVSGEDALRVLEALETIKHKLV